MRNRKTRGRRVKLVLSGLLLLALGTPAALSVGSERAGYGRAVVLRQDLAAAGVVEPTLGDLEARFRDSEFVERMSHRAGVYGACWTLASGALLALVWGLVLMALRSGRPEARFKSGMISLAVGAGTSLFAALYLGPMPGAPAWGAPFAVALFWTAVAGGYSALASFAVQSLQYAPPSAKSESCEPDSTMRPLSST